MGDAEGESQRKSQRKGEVTQRRLQQKGVDSRGSGDPNQNSESYEQTDRKHEERTVATKRLSRRRKTVSATSRWSAAKKGFGRVLP